MVALYALWYTVRQHKTLRMSPATAAGIENRLWSMDEVAALCEPKTLAKRGQYKMKAASSNFRFTGSGNYSSGHVTH